VFGDEAPVEVDGKFLRIRGERRMLAVVSYGPFPGGWPEDFGPDFERIRSAGFEAVRLYEMPGAELLDAAAAAGLVVFGGLRWEWATDFLGASGALARAKVDLAAGLREIGGHPALAGVFVANEVPPDIVRWIGPARVGEALEDLIRLGHRLRPGRLFAYSNFPSTEFLEPGNADFTAMNVFLEEEEAFRRYLRRLHHIAGDRPVVISEFGLDSRRHGLGAQAAVLRWALRAARDFGVAGFTVYSWSDRWWNAGAEVTDWDFGLTDRHGKGKPALDAVAEEWGKRDSIDLGPRAAGRRKPAAGGPASAKSEIPDFSVIVCTRNGRERIGACLEAVRAQTHPAFETIVVDDGSADGTADFLEREFPEMRVVRLAGGGLSAARNAGARAARGGIFAFTDDDCRPDPEWLVRLGREFGDGECAAVGGPNLPPRPSGVATAVVAAAPGAPSHVLIDDFHAEHLPGCNLAVRREAFEKIGGFDERFHTAGDDVDFCWRLHAEELRIGFAPTAFVWHDRRPDAIGYLRQQWGYGRAEAMLTDKFPERFARRGGARWLGCIYEGGPVRASRESVIYHGPLGDAGYQSVVDRMLPRRPVDDRFDSVLARIRLAMLERMQPWVRGFARRWFRRTRPEVHETRAVGPAAEPEPEIVEEFAFRMPGGRRRRELLDALLESGWQAAGDRSGWDLVNGRCLLLAAPEAGEKSERLTRVRIAGPAREIDAAAREVARRAADRK
jgi:hypothetical protein